MAYLVQCNRCLVTAASVFSDVDVGYWVPPPDWLTVEVGEAHLCPSCLARALEPPDFVHDPRTYKEDA